MSYVSFLSFLREKGIYRSRYVKVGNVYVYTLFVPATVRDAPVLFYVSGGPGISVMTYILTTGTEYQYDINTGTWMRDVDLQYGSNRYNIIYFDLVPDLGYNTYTGTVSFSDIDAALLGSSVLSAILKVEGLTERSIQFYGYSYAGKYLPLIAERMIEMGYCVDGMLLVNAVTDPCTQIIDPYVQYLWTQGSLSLRQREQLECIASDARRTLKSQYYIDLIDKAYEMTGLDHYDVRYTLLSDDIEVLPEDTLHNDLDVKRVLGARGEYRVVSSLFTIESYPDFLRPATDSLVSLVDRGVFVCYFTSQFDGLVHVTGTRLMMRDLFSEVQDHLWIVRDKSEISILGKISRIRPNLYTGTIYDSGHDSVPILPRRALLQYLYNRQISSEITPM